MSPGGYHSEGGTVYRSKGGSAARLKYEISIPFPSKLTCFTASSSKVQRNNFVTVIKSYLTLQESLQLHNVGLVTTMPRFFTPGPPGVREVRPCPSLPCPRCQGEKGKGGANVAPPPGRKKKMLGTWASRLKDDQRAPGQLPQSRPRGSPEKQRALQDSSPSSITSLATKRPSFRTTRPALPSPQHAQRSYFLPSEPQGAVSLHYPILQRAAVPKAGTWAMRKHPPRHLHPAGRPPSPARPGAAPE